MQENEFEKQVQQKMDELRLHPSDAVWLKVEAEIKKEKRRRWGIILFPILLVGFLYGGFLLMTRTSPVNQQQQSTNNFTAKNKIDTTNQTTRSTSDSIIYDQALIKKKNSYTQSAINNNLQAKNISGKLKFSSDHKIGSTAAQTTSKIFKSEIDTATTVAQDHDLNSTTQPTTQQPITRQEFTPTGRDQNRSLNEIVTDLNNDRKINELKTDTTPTAKKIITSNKQSWNFGFSFSGGISGTTINSGKNQNNNTNYSTYPSSGNLGSTPVFISSPIKSSIAFITGVTAEKRISSKIIFSTGLNYKLFSTTNLVGPDSTNTFRAYPLSGKHHNFFHYIDLPVAIKFQIGNSVKTPVYWNIGLSVSQLIASNALQFNPAVNLYYHDNSQFNKTQFAVNTGIDVSLISSQKVSFLVGPYFNYTISKIAKQGYYNRQFNFIGLHTQFIFRKK